MKKIWFIVMMVLCAGAAFGVDRFPRPQFEVAYEMPSTSTPAASDAGREWFDTAALAAALMLSAIVALKIRRRRAMWILMLACLAFFGFWRKGCVCPVGSIQNVSAAVGDPSYKIALTILIFFLVPLVTALFAGRVFCGSVCPLGAIQDVFVYRPVKVPLWLVVILEMLACTYLGLAVLMAVLGGDFLICRFDPFVGIFRLSAPWPMVVAGVLLLAIGLFVARPYCRFLCPYGVLLKMFSQLSWKHLAITPDDCIDCRLCAGSCPFGAINAPSPERSDEARSAAVRRMGLSILLLPVLIAGGAALGAGLSSSVAMWHPKVALAERIRLEKADPSVKSTIESDAFRATRVPVARLFSEADGLSRKFRTGTGIVGGFVGLMLGGQLFALSRRKKRDGYEPDRGRCLSCGRCVEFCPREHAVRKGIAE